MKSKLRKNEMMDIFYQRSKKHGLRITPQRTAIYQELLKAKDHPSADIIYKRIVGKIPNISFDTVNRTLLTFSKIGIANIVEGYGQPNSNYYYVIEIRKYGGWSMLSDGASMGSKNKHQ